MRTVLSATLILALAALGCGKASDHSADEAAASHGTTTAADPQGGMPADEDHQGAMPSDAMHSMGGVNTTVTLPDEVRAAWTAIRVDLVDAASGQSSTFEVPVGGQLALGESGLTLEAVAFVPDFVMDGAGITTRGPEPNNPAARVVIREQGAEDYTGWLFANMPAVHPFPHESYQVILIGGVPAG